MSRVSFATTMSGDRAAFDIPTYTSAVSAAFVVDPSFITVGIDDRRRLQSGSFTVTTQIIASSATNAVSMRERVSGYDASSFTTALMQGQTVTVDSITVDEITSVIIYPPPPMPPEPPPPTVTTLPGAGNSSLAPTTAAQSSGDSGGSSDDNTVIIVIIVAIAAVIIAGLAAFAVRRYIINKRTSTIVKAVPVTTNTQAQPDITTASATSAKPAEMEMDESKI